MVGFRVSPEAEAIKILPTIGPVQENETRTSVKAIKKTPSQPPLSAWASALVSHELGKVISNIPKNDMAKIRKIRKNITFGNQCVLRKFAASPPKSRATNVPIRV